MITSSDFHPAFEFHFGKSTLILSQCIHENLYGEPTNICEQIFFYTMHLKFNFLAILTSKTIMKTEKLKCGGKWKTAHICSPCKLYCLMTSLIWFFKSQQNLNLLLSKFIFVAWI